MASDVLTVEADGDKNSPDFFVGLLLHRDDGFRPIAYERLCVVIPQFNLQNIIEVQDGFVHVADLEILMDHPRDRFAFCAASS